MPTFDSKKKCGPRLGQLLLLTLTLSGCGGKTVDLDSGTGTPVDDADVIVNAPAGTLWIAGPYILWTDNKLVADQVTTLRGCRKDDCSHTRIAYTTLASQNVATSPTHVGFSIRSPASCLLSGCDGHPTQVFDDQNELEVALDDDYLYWLSENSLYRCPVDGCGDALPSIIAGRQAHAAPSLLVAGGNAYWRVDSELRRTKVDGSEPVAVAAAGLPPTNFRGDVAIAGGSTLYYLGANNHLYECTLPTCTEPTELVATDNEKFTLQADDQGVFWLERDNAVHFCQASGCGSAPTLASPNGAYAFTVDAGYVYWSEATTVSTNDGVPSPTGDLFSAGENIHRTAR